MSFVDALRSLAALAWLLVLAAFAGSLWRAFFGVPRPFDKVWGLIAILALHQLGFAVRWLAGWSSPIDHSASLSSLAGLHLISIMVALALFAQRRAIEGRRW